MRDVEGMVVWKVGPMMGAVRLPNEGAAGAVVLDFVEAGGSIGMAVIGAEMFPSAVPLWRPRVATTELEAAGAVASIGSTDGRWVSLRVGRTETEGGVASGGGGIVRLTEGRRIRV